MPSTPPREPADAFASATDADLVALDAQAVAVSVDLVAHVTAADLDRPTPCAGWTLHGLLAHMGTQHHGFAAASTGDGDFARWRLRPLGPDHVATYREAADVVLASFTAPGVLDRAFPLPELTTTRSFPARDAISFHLIDYVVHSWDVARTLGVEVRFDQRLLDVALGVARTVPVGGYRTAPGTPFGPVVPWTAETRLDEIVALLGRSPAWPH
ncbi:TIGR03086 family protein [Longispora fulva]|uniref:Uncharacterized protein (TIGR03086 family) n=1 Tax=Longispora fulva TaxID=619741 RepID=A0A8J7GI38_9ACTN|nr:TIGR03086 family metal-binding protein [Longispora fulva]MBG6136793.1 uncharacterized protein (TIGR03086 family) [Longispora fulva]GIG59964.1 TIGR03086 family protein [Longispora fulva]